MGLPLEGRNVIILLGPDFEDSEALYPLYRMKEAGANVTVAGLGEAVYKGKYGVPIQTDAHVDACENKKWDAVIVPGGWAPDKIRTNQAALNIVRNTNRDKGIVAAICHAGWVLASADILQGRRLTSVPAIKDDMIHAGAKWEDSEVVVDENLVTSRRPPDLPAFCREIVAAMSRVKAAV